MNSNSFACTRALARQFFPNWSRRARARCAPFTAERAVRTGRDDRAIILRGGSDSELAGTLAREATLTVMDAPGIRKTPAGKAIASAEPVVRQPATRSASR